MRANEREAVCVVLHSRQRDAPTPHAMALIAVASHLPKMKVCVTINALLAYAGEYKLGMTFPAIQSLMHAAKRIACLCMIEIRKGPNGLVTGRRVALPAGNLKGAVRAADLSVLLFHISGCCPRGVVQGVAPDADAARDILAQRGMPSAFLVLPDGAMTIETLELELAVHIDVAMPAESRAVEHCMFFFEGTGNRLGVGVQAKEQNQRPQGTV
jgi:hypothetical protein